MCTIGCVLQKGRTLVFKQCDLKKKVNFYEPVLLDGEGDIRYMKFGREGNDGSWCGVNNYGVAFGAADAYMTPEIEAGLPSNVDSKVIFNAYIGILRDHTSARDAAEAMCEFYHTFLLPDILLIADSREAYYIEAYNGEVICVKREYVEGAADNFFACTNHFRYIHGGVSYGDNHSTYLRLERAEHLLTAMKAGANGNAAEDLQGLKKLLTDRYYGRSVLSICRSDEIVPQGEEPYFTQASAIFDLSQNNIGCSYVVNGNPDEQGYTEVEKVF